MNDCESVIQVSGDGRKDSVGMSDYLNLSNGVSGSHDVEYLAAVAHDSVHIQYFRKYNIKPIIVGSGASCVAFADAILFDDLEENRDPNYVVSFGIKS